MKTYIKAFIILIGTFLYGCYDSLEINTENIDDVEIAIKAAMPLMNGTLELNIDSLVDLDELGDDMITYEEGVAYFKYDTIMDFYDELSEFLTMDDIDFGNITAFDESFSLDLEFPDLTINYNDIININSTEIEIDTTITISPQDTFEYQYETNCIFIIPSDDLNYDLTAVDLGESIDLNLPYDVYQIDISGGIISINIDHSVMNVITDKEMTVDASFNYSYGYIIDTTISQSFSIPIFQDFPQLPDGVQIRSTISIPSLINSATDKALNTEFIATSLDTTFEIDLAQYYYCSNDGSGLLDLDVAAYMEINDPKDTAVVPLPDTLFFTSKIKDMAFDHVIFNYGKDTAMTGNQKIDFDMFSDFQDDINIEGFRLSNPLLKLKLESNLGFPAQLNFDSLLFTTSDNGKEIITDTKPTIYITAPSDPLNISTCVQTGTDSIVLDSTNSQLADVDILMVNGFLVSYNVVVNPEDNANEDGKHNFFYQYDNDVMSEMYDVKLSADISIPFEFKFEKINVQQTNESPLDSSTVESLDSTIYLGENDSINLNVKLFTKNFPFDATAQFYFDILNTNGELVHLDSLFSSHQTIMPSSLETQWDSTEFSITIDQNKYENLKQLDSLTIDINLSMDEDDYFELEEGYTTEVGYKVELKNSSFVIKNK